MRNEGREFVCGACGKGPVTGIYCDKCRAARRAIAPVISNIAEGEKVKFSWHGVERDGIVIRVLRSKVEVSIEVGENQVKKTLRIPVESLAGYVVAPVALPFVTHLDIAPEAVDDFLEAQRNEEGAAEAMGS